VKRPSKSQKPQLWLWLYYIPIKLAHRTWFLGSHFKRDTRGCSNSSLMFPIFRTAHLTLIHLTKSYFLWNMACSFRWYTLC